MIDFIVRLIGAQLAYLTVILFGVSSVAVALDHGSEDTATSSICVEAANVQISQLVKDIRSGGGQILRTPGNDPVCWQLGNDYKSFSVPYGLQSWTIQQMIQLGFDTARHGDGTAGGSGFLKRRVPRSYVFQGSITPANFAQVVDEIECKLKSRLYSGFEDVAVKRACKTDFDGPELCWHAWVGGHLSNSRGLTVADLEGKLDAGYWFSARLEIWMNDYYNYYDNYGYALGPQFRVDLATLSSKFARFPASARPTADRYQYADAFGRGIDPDQVDELIAFRVLDDIVRAQMRCQ